MTRNRDVSIDVLRGIAVFTMIAPNLAAQVLAEPQPIWLRLFGSFAAPLFILISGMMVYKTTITQGYQVRHFLFRGGFIVLVGVLIDVLIWKIYPFTTVDVLYLIGVSLPIAHLFSRMNRRARWIIIGLIFAATPVLQTLLGYTSYPTELTLLGQPTVIVANQTSIFSHWIVDGWFPLFPWLGFSLLGVNLAEFRWERRKSGENRADTNILVLGALLLCLGSIAWLINPGSLLVRAGYSELFYPPTLGYVVTACGVAMILLNLVDRSRSVVVYRPLSAYGESSLFMYMFHLALIEYVIAPLLLGEDMQTFFLIYAGLAFLMAMISFGLRLFTMQSQGSPRSLGVGGAAGRQMAGLSSLLGYLVVAPGRGRAGWRPQYKA
jgi:uncharacterized membrane protein